MQRVRAAASLALGLTVACCGGAGAAEIWEIQGAGMWSPVDGAVVTTTDNVVTAVARNGFFMQTPEERSDGDSGTSDGIFVYTGGAPGVQAGDRVDVTGQVQEYYDLTEIAGNPAVTVISSGNPLPPALELNGETPSPDRPQPATEIERLEGMRVRIAEGTVCGPSDVHGDAAIVAGAGRLFREPGIEYPGEPGLAVWDGNPEKLELDPDALGLADRSLVGGARFAAEGVLSFAFGDYQLWPTELTILHRPDLPRPVRARARGELTVATQNLHRLVDDRKDGGADRIVTSRAAYGGRLSKLSRHVREVLGAPDIVAVQEVESRGVLQDVADTIADDDPKMIYTALVEQGNNGSGIEVGFLVRDTVRIGAVTQVGADVVFSLGGSLLHDRPPLVLEAEYTARGASFALTAVVVHLRSLIGIDDASDGEWVRTKRFEQAEWLARWIQERQSSAPNERLIVLGDFNAFEFSDGWVDVLGQVTGSLDPDGALLAGSDEVDPDLTNQVLSLPPVARYSFVYEGDAQTLDHVLTNQAMSPWVSGLAAARGNADVAGSYEDDGDSALRCSDHDGLVLFIAGATRRAGASGRLTTAD